ncbi:unnamed protein product [Symbiodinium microadriaticum]|nr:unnamed protein product [Symbiodinium microadriaticum]
MTPGCRCFFRVRRRSGLCSRWTSTTPNRNCSKTSSVMKPFTSPTGIKAYVNTATDEEDEKDTCRSGRDGRLCLLRGGFDFVSVDPVGGTKDFARGSTLSTSSGKVPPCRRADPGGEGSGSLVGEQEGQPSCFESLATTPLSGKPTELEAAATSLFRL